MNNEIKEILEFKEDADYKKLSCDEIKVLKDYITNLQQENKDLKETIKSINAISYQSDDEIWLNVRHYIEDLDEFANDIDHYIAQYITYNYKSHLRTIIKYLVGFFKQHCAYKR